MILIQSTREGQEGDGKETGVFRVPGEAGDLHHYVSDLLEESDQGCQSGDSLERTEFFMPE